MPSGENRYGLGIGQAFAPVCESVRDLDAVGVQDRTSDVGIGACGGGAGECAASGRNSHGRRAGAEAGREDAGNCACRRPEERESRRDSRGFGAAAQGERDGSATIESRKFQGVAGKAAQQSKREARRPTLARSGRLLLLQQLPQPFQRAMRRRLGVGARRARLFEFRILDPRVLVLVAVHAQQLPVAAVGRIVVVVAVLVVHGELAHALAAELARAAAADPRQDLEGLLAVGAGALLLRLLRLRDDIVEFRHDPRRYYRQAVYAQGRSVHMPIHVTELAAARRNAAAVPLADLPSLRTRVKPCYSSCPWQVRLQPWRPQLGCTPTYKGGGNEELQGDGAGCFDVRPAVLLRGGGQGAR